MEGLSNQITEKLENMARVEDLDQIESKRKAIVTAFPYAAWRQRGGDSRMFDAFSGVLRVPNVAPFMARPITMLLDDVCPDYPDYPNFVVTLVSPYISWRTLRFDGNTVAWWAAAALATPYTEEVGRSVVNTLLQIASVHDLKPYIPVDVWPWLKKPSSLPQVCRGRSVGTTGNVVRTVRELGDVEILESYLLLVWSEWDAIYSDGFTEMCASIREDFAGIGMGRHREVLVKRLDCVLGQFGRELGHDLSSGGYNTPEPSEQYEDLKGILLEVDREALEVLTRTSFRLFDSFNSFTCPQNPTRRLFAPSLSHVRSRAPVGPDTRSPDSVPHLYTGSLCHPLRASSTASEIVIRLSRRARPPPSPDEKHRILTPSVEAGHKAAVPRIVITAVFIQSLITQLPMIAPLLSRIFVIAFISMSLLVLAFDPGFQHIHALLFLVQA